MSAPMDTAPTDGTHFLAKWEDFETGQTIGWVETWYAVTSGKIGGWESPWEYAVAGLYGPVAWVSMSATDTRLSAAEAMAEALKSEIEARNLYLSTAPDRGGSHGPKGQRRMALENAQLQTVFALKAWEAGK